MPILIASMLYFLSILLIWQFVGYPLLMGIFALRAKPQTKDYSYKPFVSIIVPAYNEEKVIGHRIENLDSLNYPTHLYEIIVVDDGSDDGTSDVVEKLGPNRLPDQPKLILVKEPQRRGKASAINTGKEHARGEIIFVTDANASFSRDVLRDMVAHFSDPIVGAVGGRYTIVNSDQGLASEESFYWQIEYIMRMGESVLDSACLIHGEINAWRKDLVEADTEVISEDLDIAIQIRRQGYKIAYEPKAVAREFTGATPKEQIIRRRKVATGTILCIRKHLNYFILPRDLYSGLIFPSHKAFVMISPFVILAIILFYFLSGSIRVVVFHGASTGVAFSILYGALIFVKSRLMRKDEYEQRISKSPLSTLIRLALYVILNEYILVMAWMDYVRGKYSVLWDRAEATRAMPIVDQ